MRRVNRSALVPFTDRQMFELVDDVDAYDQFLPWCSRSEVLTRSGDVVEASVELKKGTINKAFTTRNTRQEYASIELELLGGPFKTLSGGWRFTPLGDSGCKVTLLLDFEFESRAVDLIFGTFFEETCNSLVDAFTQRAEEIYG